MSTAAAAGAALLCVSVTVFVDSVEKISIRADVLLFPPYTASTEWSGLITLDPTLATWIAASAGTVIDHSGQYKRLPQGDKGAVIDIPLSEVFKV
jgi:hypothetical protein